MELVIKIIGIKKAKIRNGNKRINRTIRGYAVTVW